MKLAIVIAIFNRPQYVKRCFDSLRNLTTKPDLIVLVDDKSGDTETLWMVHELVKELWCHAIMHSENVGVRGTLINGIEYALNNECDNILVLDSDVILKPNAIEVLLNMQKELKGHMVSGVNCTMLNEKGQPRNPLISEHDGYSLKSAVAGQCLLFTYGQYKAWVEPALKVNGNWDHNASINSGKHGYGVAVTVPSVAQHIGIQSSMGHTPAGVIADAADDFKEISLPNVTLFGIDGHDVTGIERAARISQHNIDFGAVKIITDDLFTKGANVEKRRAEYSKFMLKELTNHFNTSHVLTIHADGYVVNPLAWGDEWLEFDFIGSTWWFKDGMNVGNGGFSLRSKKLCDILANNHIEPNLMHPEDTCICRHYRPSLEKDFQIKFAPEEIANKFSIEAFGVPKGANKYSGQFGFHSLHVDFNGSDVPEEWRYKAAIVRPKTITTHSLTNVNGNNKRAIRG